MLHLSGPRVGCLCLVGFDLSGAWRLLVHRPGVKGLPSNSAALGSDSCILAIELHTCHLPFLPHRVYGWAFTNVSVCRKSTVWASVVTVPLVRLTVTRKVRPEGSKGVK